MFNKCNPMIEIYMVTHITYLLQFAKPLGAVVHAKVVDVQSLHRQISGLEEIADSIKIFFSVQNQLVIFVQFRVCVDFVFDESLI